MDMFYTAVIFMNVCSAPGAGPTIDMCITVGKLLVEFCRLEAD